MTKLVAIHHVKNPLPCFPSAEFYSNKTCCPRCDLWKLGRCLGSPNFLLSDCFGLYMSWRTSPFIQDWNNEPRSDARSELAVISTEICHLLAKQVATLRLPKTKRN